MVRITYRSNNFGPCVYIKDTSLVTSIVQDIIEDMQIAKEANSSLMVYSSKTSNKLISLRILQPLPDNQKKYC